MKLVVRLTRVVKDWLLEMKPSGSMESIYQIHYKSLCKLSSMALRAHGTSTTHRVAIVPCSLGNRGTLLRPAVFEGKASEGAPLILSLSFLMHCKCKLVLSEQEGLALKMQGVQDLVPLHIGPSGALRIPLQRFSEFMIKDIHQLQKDKVMQATQEFEILNLDDAIALSAQDPDRTTIDQSLHVENSHGAGTQTCKRTATEHGAAQCLVSHGAETDGPGDPHELLPGEHDPRPREQPSTGQEAGQQPQHGGLDLCPRADQRPDPQDAVGVRRGGQWKLLGDIVSTEKPEEHAAIECQLSARPEADFFLGSANGDESHDSRFRGSQSGRCAWSVSDLRRQPDMSLRTDGPLALGTDGGAQLRPDLLQVPTSDRTPMDEPDQGQGRTPMHSPSQNPPGIERNRGPGDLHNLPQGSQEGAKTSGGSQGQGQDRGHINGISGRDGRVPEVPCLAPGERELSAEELRPLTERQRRQIRSALEKSVSFWQQIQDTLLQLGQSTTEARPPRQKR